MPELPDVELFKHLFDETLLNRVAERLEIRDPRIVTGLAPEQFRRQVEGRRVIASLRHGKVLFGKMNGAGWMTMRFGTDGKLVRWAPGEPEPADERLSIFVPDSVRLAYVNRRMLGSVGLVDYADRFIHWERLGPDVLDPAFDLAAFQRALAGRRTDLKRALTDQSRLAGIGNIDADEILLQAQLSPQARADRLSAAALERLFRAMKMVLVTAVARGAGSEALTERLRETFLLPFRHRNGRCPRCSEPLQTVRIGGRITSLRALSAAVTGRLPLSRGGAGRFERRRVTRERRTASSDR